MMRDRGGSLLGQLVGAGVIVVVGLLVLEWLTDLISRVWPELLALTALIIATTMAVRIWRRHSRREW